MKKNRLIAVAASIFIALTFTISCSDEKEDPPGNGKWCIINVCDGYDEEEGRCIEIQEQICQQIGATYNGYVLTEAFCKRPPYVSIEDEKPSGCREPGEDWGTD